jgi:hypothetical protein
MGKIYNVLIVIIKRKVINSKFHNLIHVNTLIGTLLYYKWLSQKNPLQLFYIIEQQRSKYYRVGCLFDQNGPKDQLGTLGAF